jgi:hypothetical protein
MITNEMSKHTTILSTSAYEIGIIEDSHKEGILLLGVEMRMRI